MFISVSFCESLHISLVVYGTVGMGYSLAPGELVSVCTAKMVIPAAVSMSSQ